MLAQAIAASGLAIEVAGTFLISVDALGSQREVRDSIDFLEGVTHLEVDRTAYVKAEDLEMEIRVVLAKAAGERSAADTSKLEEALKRKQKIADDLAILGAAQEIAIERNRENLEKKLDAIRRSSARREPRIRIAIVLVALGGIVEIAGVLLGA